MKNKNNKPHKVIDMDSMVDIVCGKMTLKDLSEEINNLYLHRNPKITIIIIEGDKQKNLKSTIYIPNKDFKKYK